MSYDLDSAQNALLLLLADPYMQEGITEEEKLGVLMLLHWRETRAQLTEAVEALKLVEWGAPDYPNYEPRCPACRGFKPVGPNEAQYRPGTQVGHAPDCRLKKAIG